MQFYHNLLMGGGGASGVEFYFIGFSKKPSLVTSGALIRFSLYSVIILKNKKKSLTFHERKLNTLWI